MRKIVAHLLLTLDGVATFDAPLVDSIIHLRDAEVEADFAARLAEEDAMLLGRTTYVEWAAYWPTSTVEPFASHINAVPKYVASTTLESAPWGEAGEAALLGADVIAAVAALRRSDGGSIGLHGSPTLLRRLLDADLIDELRLEIYPVIAGGIGPKFSDGGLARPLEPLRSMTSPSGVVVLGFRPGRSA
jgi:dihydrofolate reductase